MPTSSGGIRVVWMGHVVEPTLTDELIRRAPRCCCTTTSTAVCAPQTIVELAARDRAPAARPTTPTSLGRWFVESADTGSLERYLETFDHTVAVMQRADQLTRVARECVEDLAADGVVYAEVRYAPEQHLEGT